MGSSRRTKCEGGVSEQHRVCRDRHAREVDVVETQRVNPTLAEALCQGVVTSSAGGANPTPSEALCLSVVTSSAGGANPTPSETLSECGRVRRPRDSLGGKSIYSVR